MNPIDWIFGKLEMILLKPSLDYLSRKPTFKPAKEFKPIRAWTKLYSEQENLLFNKHDEIEVYRTKDHAEFRKRCHGMLAGFVKIVPCEITILEEVEDEKETEEENLPKM